MAAGPGSFSLIVGDLKPSAFGNIAAALSKGLVELGVEVDIVHHIGERDSTRRFDPRVSITKLRTSRSLYSSPAIASYLSKNSPAVAISLGWLQNASSSLATALSRWSGKLILSEHGHMDYEARVEHGDKFLYRNLPRFARRFYPRASGLVAVDVDVLDGLETRVRLDRRRLPMEVIPNPLDANMIREMADEDVGLLSHPLVVSVGRLAPQKNHSLLIEAFARVTQKVDAHLILVGDGPLRSSLEKEVAGRALSDRVSFVGEVDNPYPFLKAADVFALSSKVEGFPLSLLEALALGRPVVATRASNGPIEILERGRSGVLVDPDDAPALADAITGLLADGERQRELSKAALARSDDFTPTAIASRWMQFAERLTGV
ncbi:MAG: glycosyltransferase [Actinomycetota bacterium]|nr:glycosyltransferase [Actinomycetota bacterium]